SVNYSGPTPPPWVAAGYEALVPRAAERFIVVAEEEQRHRHDMDRRTIEAQSADHRRNCRKVSQVYYCSSWHSFDAPASNNSDVRRSLGGERVWTRVRSLPVLRQESFDLVAVVAHERQHRGPASRQHPLEVVR